MSASNQTTAAASSGLGGSPAPGTKGSAAGRKSRPTLRPPLAAINSWISGSGSARPRSGSSSISTISGTSRPSARPTSPATSSATSARGPCPAPRNFRTYRPSSSASTSPGIEPPSRSGVTYRVAVTVRGPVVVGAPSLTAATLDPPRAPRPAGPRAAMVASHARAGRDMMLHARRGGSPVSGIEPPGVGGDVVPWRAALQEGPLPADADAAQLRAVRARFLADCGWGEAAAIEAGMRARDERLAAARDTGEPIVLWFEHDLYDQLQLLQVLDAVDGAAAVEAILPDRFLGAMAPDELAALWDERAPVRRDEVALARLAWEAVRAPEPAGIGALLDTHTAALPHLAPALRRLLEELPAVGDGLSRTERQALAAIAAGARTPPEVFAAAQRAEEAAFLGDTWMWRACTSSARVSGASCRRAPARPSARRRRGPGARRSPPTSSSSRTRGARCSPARPTAQRSSRSTAGSAGSASGARSPRGASTPPAGARSPHDQRADDRPEQRAHADHEDQRRVARRYEVVDRDQVVVREAEREQQERDGDGGDRLRDEPALLPRRLLARRGGGRARRIHVGHRRTSVTRRRPGGAGRRRSAIMRRPHARGGHLRQRRPDARHRAHVDARRGRALRALRHRVHARPQARDARDVGRDVGAGDGAPPQPARARLGAQRRAARARPRRARRRRRPADGGRR